MKKVYCDRCGKEVEQNHNIILRRANPLAAGEQYYDLCPSCKEAFIGWINGTPVEQEKPYKVEKPIRKDSRTTKHTVEEVATVTGAPESTVRRHLDGITCPSTYGKDKQGRTIRYYHLTDEQLETVTNHIINRQQGRRIVNP